ncbi:MAG: hypothetical protein NTU58_02105 [Candidatus Nealsonbacteria bacterium]|nr:hypothetical protein [Candidatus Nealsonbacteria bacterium]
MKILPSITTTRFSPLYSNWREKITEAKELHLKEFCFFPTCLDKNERKEAYELLKKIRIKNIPLIHLREEDMDFKEIEYLINNFNAKAFNIHSQSEHQSHPFIHDYSKSKYRKIIFIENTRKPLNEKEIKKLGGVCLDFAHLENDRLLENEKFNYNIKVIEKCHIGCNHVSAICKTTHLDGQGKTRHDRHFLENFSELDYLKKYPINYFSDFTALELENNLEEQLEMIDYINNLLKK